MTPQEHVIEIAKEWVGTPYHHQARIKGAGVDCGQLLIAVFSEAGMCPPDLDVGHYSHDWAFHRNDEIYLRWVKEFCVRKNGTDKPEKGDIAVFRFGRAASHGTIVMDWPMVIHSFFGRGVIISGADDIDLAGRLDSVWTPRPWVAKP